MNGLDVRVRFFCMSACANYVFVAANIKVIEPGALVVWHGSAEQKDFRELQQKYESILASQNERPTALPDQERRFLVDFAKSFEGIKRARRKQAAFFEEIGLNKAITSLGQEPIDYGVDAWTTSVAVMEMHGISNVEAPAKYGSAASIKRHPLFRLLLKGELVSFSLDDNAALAAEIVR